MEQTLRQRILPEVDEGQLQDESDKVATSVESSLGSINPLNEDSAMFDPSAFVDRANSMQDDVELSGMLDTSGMMNRLSGVRGQVEGMASEAQDMVGEVGETFSSDLVVQPEMGGGGGTGGGETRSDMMENVTLADLQDSMEDNSEYLEGMLEQQNFEQNQGYLQRIEDSMAGGGFMGGERDSSGSVEGDVAGGAGGGFIGSLETMMPGGGGDQGDGAGGGGDYKGMMQGTKEVLSKTATGTDNAKGLDEGSFEGLKLAMEENNETLKRGGATVGLSMLALGFLNGIYRRMKGMENASPLLGSVFDMLGQIKDLALMPFANAIANLLLPMVSDLLGFVAEFNQIMMSGDWAAGFQFLLDGLINAIFSIEGFILAGMTLIGRYLGKWVGRLIANLVKLLGKKVLMRLATGIGSRIVQYFSGSAFSGIGAAIGGAIGALIGPLGAVIGAKIGSLIGFLVGTYIIMKLPEIIEWIAGILGNMDELIANVETWLMGLYMMLVPPLLEWLSKSKKWLMGLWQTLVKYYDSAKKWLGGIWDTLKEVAGNFLSDAGDIASKLIGDGINWVEDAFNGGVNWIEDAFNGGVNWAEDAFAGGINWAEDVFNGGVNIAEDVFNGGVNIVEDLFNGGVSLVDDVFDGGIELLDDVFGGGIDLLEDVFGGGIDLLEDVFYGGIDLLEDVFGGGIDLLSEVFNGGINLLDEVFNGGIDLLEEVFNGGIDLLNQVFDGGINLLDEVFNGGIDLLNEVFGGGIDLLNAVFNGGINVLQDVFSGGYQSVTNVAKDIFNSYANVTQLAKDIFADGYSTLLNLVKDVFGGVYSSVSALAGDVFGVVTNAMDIINSISWPTIDPWDVVGSISWPTIGVGDLPFTSNAEGGVARKPQVSSLAEKEPEVIIPFSKLDSFVRSVAMGQKPSVIPDASQVPVSGSGLMETAGSVAGGLGGAADAVNEAVSARGGSGISSVSTTVQNVTEADMSVSVQASEMGGNTLSESEIENAVERGMSSADTDDATVESQLARVVREIKRLRDDMDLNVELQSNEKWQVNQ